MPGYSMWELQKAVALILAAAGPLTALLAAPPDGFAASIFDAVPEKAVYPYVVIGDDTGRDWSTKDASGLEIDVTIHAWSRYRGRKEAKQILEQVHEALHEAALALTGHVSVLMRFDDFTTVFLDGDGLTRHGVSRFKALTHQS